MKLTRMFLLKAFDKDYKHFDNNEPVGSLKNLIITNQNIDMLISFILSFLYTISIGFINSSFYDKYPINFLFASKFILFISFLFFLIESFRITVIVWEKYIRSLNKPLESSPRNSIQNNSNNNDKKRVEMDDIENIKDSLLNKDNNNENEENKFDINENVKNKIIKNNKNYLETYYEQKLVSPVTMNDKFFIKLYIFLINKLNNYLAKNENYIDQKLNKFSLYLIIIKYPHTLSCIIHFIKFLLFILSFGFSFLFWVLFVPNKMQLNKYSFNVINIFIGECFSLYCLFRLCYFLLKFIANFIMCPIYLSSLYLGYYEDQINDKLNELINTRIYINESSLISRDSLNKYKKNEILTSCSICLENYIKGDVISTLPCSKRHTFHSYCLEEWFFSSIVCPLCRYDFSKEFAMLFADNNNQENNNNNFFQNILNNINDNAHDVNDLYIMNENNNNDEQQIHNNFINNNVNIVNIINDAQNPVLNIEMHELNNNDNINNNINNNNENNNNNAGNNNNINH